MLATLLPSLVAPGAMAQEPPPATAPPPVVLSLQDTLKAALQNNLDIAVRSYDPLRSESRVIASEAAFDPLLTGTSVSSEMERPSPSAFVRASKTHDFSVAFEDPLITGGRYRIDLDAFDNRATTVFTPISREFDTSWKVSITQPLLRNLGAGTNRYLVVIARNDLGVNESRFRQTVMDTLASAEKAYWDLNFALMDLKTRRAALQLAKDFLEQNRIKVRVGTLAPIEITQAEAGVADREEGVIIAEHAVKTAEDALRRVMNAEKDSAVWSQPIQPSDAPPLIEVTPDMEAAVATAQQRRPDLEQARLAFKNQEAELAYRRNQRRWGLDLRGEYGKVGIGFDQFLRDTVTGDLILDPVTGKPIVTAHGSYGDSVDDLRDGENREWRLSLTLGVPVGNRLAEANYADADYALSQARYRLDTVEQAARLEVRNAVRTVDTNLKRVKAAQVNVRLQREKLQAEQKKFENGMSTSFQVLQFQTDLTTAESRENAAIVDYNKSLAELQRVQGTLLEARNITMPGRDLRRKMPFHPRSEVTGWGAVAREALLPESVKLPGEFVFDGRRLVARGPAAP
jgi:outer membrane protein TolC